MLMLVLLVLISPVVVGCSPAPPRDPIVWIVADSHGVPADAWPRLMPCDVSVAAWGGWPLTTRSTSWPVPFDEDTTFPERVIRGDRLIVALGYNDLAGSTTSELRAARAAVEQRYRALGVSVEWTTLVPLSANYPFPALRPTINARRAQWDKDIGANAVVVGSVFGPELPSWAVGPDGVHMSPAGQYIAALAAAPGVCPG